MRKTSSDCSDGIGPESMYPKILVVDDNPFNVKSIKMMLQHCFGLDCDTVRYLNINF